MIPVAQEHAVLALEDMRQRWKKGQISTGEYHDFIERTKRYMAKSDQAYRFY